MQALTGLVFAVIFFVCSCNSQAGISPWSTSGGKLLIITDPESGAIIYIPASLFYQRLSVANNSFVCDLLTWSCLTPNVQNHPELRTSENDEPNWNERNRDVEKKSNETVSAGSNGIEAEGPKSTIFGHAHFHQGEFPEPTTKRPFRPWTSGNSFSASSGPAGSSSARTSTTTGRGGTIFGHPTFHQGEFTQDSTTQRPFRPWTPQKSEGNTITAGSSVSDTRSGRQKRSSYSSSSRSSSSSGGGNWDQSHYSSHTPDFPAPNYDHFAYMQQHFKNAEENFKKSFGGAGPGGFAGAGASNFGYGGYNHGHFPAGFPETGPHYNNYAGAGSSASSSSSSSRDVTGRFNQYSGSSNSYGPVGSGSSYSYNSGSGSDSHYHQGDYSGDDMHYSTVTGKDGMVQTTMEGKKCDANGCRSSSSSSMVYNPDSKTGYSKSGRQYSGYVGTGSSSSSSSGSDSSFSDSHHASSRTGAGSDTSHYVLESKPKSTTNKPYSYSTTQRPYTYSTSPTTAKYQYTDSTKAAYTYTSTTTDKPYVYSTNSPPPKARQ